MVLCWAMIWSTTNGIMSSGWDVINVTNGIMIKFLPFWFIVPADGICQADLNEETVACQETNSDEGLPSHCWYFTIQSPISNPHFNWLTVLLVNSSVVYSLNILTLWSWSHFWSMFVGMFVMFVHFADWYPRVWAQHQSSGMCVSWSPVVHCKYPLVI